MIKILEGRKVFETTCPHCGAVLQYESEDVKLGPSPLSGHKGVEYIECAVADCKQRINLKSLPIMRS